MMFIGIKWEIIRFNLKVSEYKLYMNISYKILVIISLKI